MVQGLLQSLGMYNPFANEEAEEEPKQRFSFYRYSDTPPGVFSRSSLCCQTPPPTEHTGFTILQQPFSSLHTSSGTTGSSRAHAAGHAGGP
jgi:hypothetical protein